MYSYNPGEKSPFLTLEELAKEVGRSENTLLKNFKVTQERLAKRGIVITKYGMGKTAKYKVEYKAIDVE